jgi:hypothetical protein
MSNGAEGASVMVRWVIVTGSLGVWGDVAEWAWVDGRQSSGDGDWDGGGDEASKDRARGRSRDGRKAEREWEDVLVNGVNQ